MENNRGELGATAVRVVGISGSLRRESFTRLAVAEALEGAKLAGADTQLIDLRNYHLIFAGGEEGADAPDVARLRREVTAAHGIILGTPEYHGSFSGVLKNALDLMGFDEFEGKMIGLVGVGGGRTGAFDALNALRNVGRALHAWVVPQQVSIPEAHNAFGLDGHIEDLDLQARLREVGCKVAEFARLHEAGRAQEFVRNWENAMENPGG